MPYSMPQEIVWRFHRNSFDDVGKINIYKLK